MSSLHDQARAIVLVQLPNEGVTSEMIERTVRSVVGYLSGAHASAEFDIDRLVEEVEAMCNVWVPASTNLDSNEQHVAWLEERRDGIDWRFWSRYERYLREVQALPRVAVDRLDEITDGVLARFEDPARAGAWDRRGLVVGQVQSGKTQNYTAVVCKAIDAGYKLVVVLAGMHNSLRSQTQLRLDEGVLGFDTRSRRTFDRTNIRMGVGNLHGEFLHANSFTSSDDRGDFSLSVAKNIGVSVGGKDPVILVVKKNQSILKNLHQWATSIRKEVDPESGRSVVRGVPLLVIDDEADNASVDTGDPSRGSGRGEYNPTAINRLIRQLLRSFDQSIYLGYTATPFANIFIDNEAETERYGRDLFPSSFIVSLPAPSSYVGPSRVFGLAADVGKNITEVQPLPIVRDVDDAETWMPDGHRKDHVPGAIPASLREAILTYVLAGAVKSARGLGGGHHSMLVHLTRYTAVQALVSGQVERVVEDLQLRLRYGDGAATPTAIDELRTLYERDFLTTFRSARAHIDVADQFGAAPSWEELAPLLPHVADRIHIKTINGLASDALEYRDHPDGAFFIAVGGNKLSRGLTLEGLAVSYYLRASRMYDTLMQMGRWFGYRRGYLDVCRLYTTPELQRWYSAVTAANEELIREFEYMAAIGKTPRDFGLRVAQHPDGLLVTARTKLRNARRVSISFAGDISETIIFKTDPGAVRQNLEAAEELIRGAVRMGGPGVRRAGPLSSLMWARIPPAPILEFLKGYSSHPDALKVVPKTLGDYILARNADEVSELTDWTVLLVSNSTATGNQVRLVADQELGLLVRAQWPEDKQEPGRYSIRRLLSPSDEMVDVDDEGRRRALAMTRKAWESSTRKGKGDTPPDIPSGIAIRHQRVPTKGLILVYPLDPATLRQDSQEPIVGFAISFPHSERAKPVDYQVNNVYWQQEFDFVNEEAE